MSNIEFRSSGPEMPDLTPYLKERGELLQGGVEEAVHELDLAEQNLNNAINRYQDCRNALAYRLERAESEIAGHVISSDIKQAAQGKIQQANFRLSAFYLDL